MPSVRRGRHTGYLTVDRGHARQRRREFNRRLGGKRSSAPLDPAGVPGTYAV